MKEFAVAVLGGYIVACLHSFLFWTGTEPYKLGQEVQKVINVCEEKLPRNEKCTFLIVPESKLIYDEEKSDE